MYSIHEGFILAQLKTLGKSPYKYAVDDTSHNNYVHDMSWGKLSCSGRGIKNTYKYTSWICVQGPKYALGI